MRPSTLAPLGLALILAVPARAQTAGDSVRAVITALFDGMRAGDSTAVLAAFHPDGRLMTAARVRDGSERVDETPVAAFAHAVGTKPAGSVWDERLGEVEVRVDGPLASVWAPYHFYADGALSHCGVNEFQIVRAAGAWRILQITDTRRRAGCTPE